MSEKPAHELTFVLNGASDRFFDISTLSSPRTAINSGDIIERAVKEESIAIRKNNRYNALLPIGGEHAVVEGSEGRYRLLIGDRGRSQLERDQQRF
jgi:hypothetical protein